MRTIPRLSILALSLLSLAACRTERPRAPGYLSTSYEEPERPDESSAGGTSPSEVATTGDDAPPSEDAPPTTTAAFVAGPGGVPLPPDAEEQSGMAPAGGKLSVFKIPRNRDAVVEELRVNLASDGWTITNEELSPSHRALRLKIDKRGSTLDVRVTGDGNDAAIIVTVP